MNPVAMTIITRRKKKIGRGVHRIGDRCSQVLDTTD